MYRLPVRIEKTKDITDDLDFSSDLDSLLKTVERLKSQYGNANIHKEYYGHDGGFEVFLVNYLLDTKKVEQDKKAIQKKITQLEQKLVDIIPGSETFKKFDRQLKNQLKQLQEIEEAIEANMEKVV